MSHTYNIKLSTYNPYHHYKYDLMLGDRLSLWPKENPYIKNLVNVHEDVSVNEFMTERVKELLDKCIKENKEKNMTKFRDFCYKCNCTKKNDCIRCDQCRMEFNGSKIEPSYFQEASDKEIIEQAKAQFNSVFGLSNVNYKPFSRNNGMPKIKDVRFNGPATIVFWDDATKTVVKAQDEDIDYEKGLAMAIAKKALGNKGKYFNEFKKWIPEEKKEEPNPIGKVVSTLMDARGATFECTIDDIDTFKQLIATTDDGKTFNISFEGVVKDVSKEEEPKDSPEFFDFKCFCKYMSNGYGNNGDDHTTIDDYCNYEGNYGKYCREYNCPCFGKKEEK